MAVIRLPRSEVAAGQGPPRLGRLLIDPATGVVIGRCIEVNETTGTVDAMIDDARIGEVMTRLRRAQLNAEPVNSAGQVRISCHQSIWHAHTVHEGVGLVGSGRTPVAAFYSLVDSCPAAATARIVKAVGTETEGFQILIRSRGTGYTSQIESFGDSMSGYGTTVGDAVSYLRTLATGWSLSDAILPHPECQNSRQKIVLQGTGVNVRMPPEGRRQEVYIAEWDASYLKPLLQGNGSTPEKAVADLVSQSSRMGMYLHTTSPQFYIKNWSNEPFAVHCQQIRENEWIFRGQGILPEDRTFREIINNEDPDTAFEILQERYPNHVFAEPVVERLQLRDDDTGVGNRRTRAIVAANPHLFPDPSGGRPMGFPIPLQAPQFHEPVTVRTSSDGPGRSRRRVEL